MPVNGISNTGSYTIAANTVPCSGSCKIKIADASNTSIYDSTDGYVNLIPRLDSMTSSLTFEKVPGSPSSNLTTSFSDISNKLHRMSWTSSSADRCEFVNTNPGGSSNHAFVQGLLAKFIYRSDYQANKFTSGTLDFYIGPDGPAGHSAKSTTPTIVTLRCYQGTTSKDTTASLLIQ